MNIFSKELMRNNNQLKLFLIDKKKNLKLNIQQQEELKEMCLCYLNKISEFLDNNTSTKNIDTFLKLLEELKKSLNVINDTIESLNNQLQTLNKIIKKLEKGTLKQKEETLESFYSNYQAVQNSTLQNTLQINSFITSLMSNSELKLSSNFDIISSFKASTDNAKTDQNNENDSDNFDELEMNDNNSIKSNKTNKKDFTIIDNDDANDETEVAVAVSAKSKNFDNIEETNSVAELNKSILNETINFDKVGDTDVVATAPITNDFDEVDAADVVAAAPITNDFDEVDAADVVAAAPIINDFDEVDAADVVAAAPIINDNDEQDNNLHENTLIISEKKNKVFLPYMINDLKEIKESSPTEYSNYQQIIDDQFTIPYKRFKNFPISRFKEGFNLMRKVENGTFKESFDLGMELLFDSNLHPAIIRACRNLDELDNYLDCLDNDETDKFNGFNIVFESAPMVSSKH